MKFFINLQSGVPIYRQLIMQIEKGVAAGILMPKEQLPTIREVALELTINPNTVARAYRELEAKGIIISVHGRGTYISEDINSDIKSKSERIIREEFKEIINEAKQFGIMPERIMDILKEELEQYENGGKENE